MGKARFSEAKPGCLQVTPKRSGASLVEDVIRVIVEEVVNAVVAFLSRRTAVLNHVR
jgi:hypothetical protein